MKWRQAAASRLASFWIASAPNTRFRARPSEAPQVIILPSAERDISEAYEWLVAQDAEAAIRWYNRLLEVIFSLDVFTERAPLAPESKSFHREIREVLHGRRQHNYQILFTVAESEVHILHVRHGARLALEAIEPSEA